MTKKRTVSDNVKVWRWIERRMDSKQERNMEYGICAQFVELNHPSSQRIPRFPSDVISRESARAHASLEAYAADHGGFWWPLTARGYNSRKAFCRRMAREAAKS